MNTFNQRNMSSVQCVSSAGLSFGYSSTVPAFLVLTDTHLYRLMTLTVCAAEEIKSSGSDL